MPGDASCKRILFLAQTRESSAAATVPRPHIWVGGASLAGLPGCVITAPACRPCSAAAVDLKPAGDHLAAGVGLSLFLSRALACRRPPHRRRRPGVVGAAAVFRPCLDRRLGRVARPHRAPPPLPCLSRAAYALLAPAWPGARCALVTRTPGYPRTAQLWSNRRRRGHQSSHRGRWVGRERPRPLGIVG